MALTDEDSQDYEVVKKQVLQAYSLVPEAYRQNFRELRKHPDTSHLVLARGKRDAFAATLADKLILACRDRHSLTSCSTSGISSLLKNKFKPKNTGQPGHPTSGKGTSKPLTTHSRAHFVVKFNYSGIRGHKKTLCWRKLHNALAPKVSLLLN